MIKWVVCYLISLSLNLWLARFGGARLLERFIYGSDAEVIKFFSWIWIALSTIGFILGMLFPSIRQLIADVVGIPYVK